MTPPPPEAPAAPPSRGERLAQAVALGLAALALWRLVSALSHVPVSAAMDMLPVYLGAKALLAGLDPYDPVALEGLFRELGAPMKVGGFYNYYPPSALVLFAPLSALPWRSFSELMRLVGGLSLVLGAALAAWRGGPRAGVWVAVAAVLGTRVAFVVLRTGQVSPLVVLACGLALWAMREDRDGLAGVAVGLGMALKLFPVVLLPVALVQRRWRMLIGALGVTLATWLVAFALLPEGASWDPLKVLGFVTRPPPHEWLLHERPLLKLLFDLRFYLGGGAAALALGYGLLYALFDAFEEWDTGVAVLAAGGFVMAGSAHYHESILLMPALAALIGGWPRALAPWALLVLLAALGTLTLQGPHTQPHWLWIGLAAILAPFFTARGLAVAAISLVFGCAPPETARWTPVEPAAAWPDEAGEPLPLPPSLEGLDWLQDVSHYGQQGQAEGRASAGSYGLGNGLVFGVLGLDRPWSTLTGAVGPGYQLDGGFFGDASLHLARGGVALEPEAEQVQRPRGSAMVRTGAWAQDLLLSELALAVPGEPAILRHVAVHNLGASTISDARVQVHLATAADESPPEEPEALLQRRGARELRVACEGGQAVIVEDERVLELFVPTLAPGEVFEALCVWSFSTSGAHLQPEDFDLIEITEDARGETAAWLGQGSPLELADPKAEDLIEGLLLMLRTQTTPDGLVSPMNRYTKGWLRDAEGPVRLLLRTGHVGEARRVLDATYQALALRGELSNSFSLDTDFSAFEEPAPGFWYEVPFMPSREPAEAPSYPALLHGLVLDRQGDASLLDGQRMEFLEAGLLRQAIDEDGMMPFSGDETFRYPMLGVLGAEPEALGWSANSSFLFAAAAERVLEMGGDPAIAEPLALVEQGLAEHYWQGDFWAPLLEYGDLDPYDTPYEDVSLQPLWWGWRGPEDAQALSNLAVSAAELLREDGTMLSQDSIAGGENFGYTGMVPGFWLQSAARAHLHPEAERAFDALDLVATPSGHFEEGHAPDNRPLALTHDPSGMGGDTPARYRPWEGGDVGAAALAYLLGDRPDALAGRLVVAPHLPEGWDRVSASGLVMGEGTYALSLEAFEEGRVARIRREGGEGPWSLRVELDGPFSELWVGETRVARGTGELVALELELAEGETVEVVGVW